MFSFDVDSSDFYLAQLLNMYIHMPETAEAIHPYIVHRFVRHLHNNDRSCMCV